MSDILYTVEQVISFCRDRKTHIVIIDRNDRKNQDFRAAVGLTYEDEVEEIRKLRVENLYHEPYFDRDIPNNYLYEFRKEVCGKWCYIKLTIVDKNKILVKVISFHESEGAKYV